MPKRTIHSNQSGYVEGRFIGETIGTIDDIMEFTKCEGIGVILAFLDFEKACDSVKWNFLHKCLKNGSPCYTLTSRVVFLIMVCIRIFLLFEKGVHQGDPLSPYLFIAAVEILAIAIRANNNIRGISIGDQEYKLVQYADDKTGILKDEESLKVFFEDLCLGVYLTYDYDEFIKLDYKQRLKKMEDTANWWRGRGLTMYGRAQIINSLLLSKLIYIARMFPVPEEVIKEANRIIFKFLW